MWNRHKFDLDCYANPKPLLLFFAAGCLLALLLGWDWIPWAVGAAFWGVITLIHWHFD